MALITRGDLEQFRVKLLADIKGLLSEVPPANRKTWLKGSEVRKLLGISAGSLQNLRSTGQLKSSKVGGVHFYRYEDIDNMMQPNP